MSKSKLGLNTFYLKIISVILGCMCLLSTSNAMNTKYSSDNIAMQHTLLNVLQMMENVSGRTYHLF